MKNKDFLIVFNSAMGTFIIGLLVLILIQSFDIIALKKDQKEIINMNIETININEELNDEIEQLKENILAKENYDQKIEENKNLKIISDELNNKILDYIKETESIKNKLNQ